MARHLEACRSADVGKAEAGDLLVESPRERANPFRVSRLIAVEGALPRLRLEPCARSFQELGYHRMVGGHEAREKARRRAQPRPVVVRKHLHVASARGDRLLTHPQLPHEPRALGFPHLSEPTRWEPNVDGAEVVFVEWQEGGDANSMWFGE